MKNLKYPLSGRALRQKFLISFIQCYYAFRSALEQKNRLGGFPGSLIRVPPLPSALDGIAYERQPLQRARVRERDQPHGLRAETGAARRLSSGGAE